MLPYHIYVPNSDELLNASLYGPGALIRVERSATKAGVYAEQGTVALGAGTAYYVYYDAGGTAGDWYQHRYSDSGGSAFSPYSPVRQGGIDTGLVDIAVVKDRLGIKSTDHSDDALLQAFIDATTRTIQLITTCHFVGDTSDQVYYFDGYEARNGMVLPVPIGIQSVTKLELAIMTGASFAEVPSTAFFLDPPRPDPGWPYTQISLSDQPMGWWYWFYPGHHTIRVTGKLGWPEVPADIQQIAINVMIRLYRARASGEGDVVGTTALGNAIVARRISPEERKQLADIYGHGPAIG